MPRRIEAASTVLLRMAGWLAVVTVVVLSLLPGSVRPHVLSNNYEEHFVAYLATGCLLGAGYPGLRPRLLLAIALTIAAGSLELAQFFVAGRTASVADLAASAAGAWLGFNLPHLAYRLYRRRSPQM